MRKSGTSIDHNNMALLNETSSLPEGAALIDFPVLRDARGSLMAMDLPDLPFVPQRVFTVTGCAGGAVRGRHSHRTNRQLMCCVAGRVSVGIGSPEHTVDLVPEGSALLIEPGVWSEQRFGSDQDRLLVLASEPYTPNSHVT
jgi:UDP-2-acetamido-3-amino-2,3-dideoxy-glucuronate N-acetyltransferase